MTVIYQRRLNRLPRFSRLGRVIIVVVALTVGLSAARFGPSAISSWKQERWLRKARVLLAEKQVLAAVIYLRRTLTINPNNLAATRVLADVAASYSPTEALPLRERVCRLAPTSPQDATAWALAALQCGQVSQAEEAFSLLAQSGLQDFAFHDLGARIAIAHDRTSEARRHLTAALAIDPSDANCRSELASIEIKMLAPALQTEARATLGQLRRLPGSHLTALRALVNDAISRNASAEALPLALELVGDSRAVFQDRLVYLGLLREQENLFSAASNRFEAKEEIHLSLVQERRKTSFEVYLSELQTEARDTPEKIAMLVGFLNSCGLSLLSCEWVGQLPEPLTLDPPIAPVLAEAYLLSSAWTRLDALLLTSRWPNLEFLHSAYLARSLRQKGDEAAAATQWTEAVQMSEYRGDRLDKLARMAYGWDWLDEWEDLLWVAVKTSKRPRDPLLNLADFYRDRLNGQKLFTVWDRLLQLDPADFAARKNWARLSFVLKGDPYRTGAVAEELYRQHPDDAEVAVTYALVQNQRELYAEALDIMNRLTPEQLKSPRVAGFHGVILAANRQPAAAAEFFARAREAPLLREEREIIDHARRSLD